MTGPIRRLDHVAIVVADTEAALAHFRDHLGLEVTSSEEVAAARVRLTYLDAGNLFLQLVEPLDDDGPLGQVLASRGEGLHHLGFGVDDVERDARELAPDGAPAPVLGTGRGRVSAFVPGSTPHGVTLECVAFDRQADVADVTGWLP